MRIALCVLLGLMLALGLSGCNSDGDNPEPPPYGGGVY